MNFQIYLVGAMVACCASVTDNDCQKPACPEACGDYACDCDDGSAGMCIGTTCNGNGCDQCQSGYFKKNYNYPCVGCQEIFGDDCLHCTDFLGCQQCSNGVRTYDPDCGLYYCAICFDSTESDHSEEVTPSPTEEPTEESLESGDTFGPCGYFSVDFVASADYDYLLGTYMYSGENTVDGSPIYELDGDDDGDRIITAYQDMDGSGDFVLEYDSQDGVAITYFVLAVDNLDEAVGTNTWEIIGSTQGEVDITIAVYDCGGNTLNLSPEDVDTCDADCIDVTNFYVNITTELGEYLESELGYVGGVRAFNGRYCFDSNCSFDSDNLNSTLTSYSGCYVREAETDDLYSAGLGINDETRKITFIWDFEDSNYIAEYSVPFNDGDLACQEIINDFFNDNSATWMFESDDYPDINGEDVNVMPDFEFDDCVGQDFCCGIAANNAWRFKISMRLGFVFAGMWIMLMLILVG